jgi:hypothetical protein
MNAALLNGIAGRSIELCEGLRLVSGQAAMQVLPGVLAVGEQAGSTGRELLMALPLGYDVAARLATGFTPHRPSSLAPWPFPAVGRSTDFEDNALRKDTQSPTSVDRPTTKSKTMPETTNPTFPTPEPDEVPSRTPLLTATSRPLDDWRSTR